MPIATNELFDYFDFTKGSTAYKVKQTKLTIGNPDLTVFTFDENGLNQTTTLLYFNITDYPDIFNIEFVAKCDVFTRYSTWDYLFSFGTHANYYNDTPINPISILNKRNSIPTIELKDFIPDVRNFVNSFHKYNYTIYNGSASTLEIDNKWYCSVDMPDKISLKTFYFFGTGNRLSLNGSIKYVKLYNGDNGYGVVYENKKDIYGILK
nr:MAG TPA: hypothetical protein [Caudoviricetes sp.]